MLLKKEIEPESLFKKDIISRMSVVFPIPDSPTMATNSPGLMCKDVSSKMESSLYPKVMCSKSAPIEVCSLDVPLLANPEFQ